MLSFSIGGNAMDFTVCACQTDVPCKAAVCSVNNDNRSNSFDFSQEIGLNKLQTLSSSDIEFGARVSETYSYANNFRLRRIIEVSNLIQDLMHKFCLLRENLLVSDQGKFHYSDKDPHYASISSDYYIFALRRILI